MAQVEGREERCNGPTFSLTAAAESFHESTVFPFSAPTAAETLAFPPDPDDLLSTQVLQGVMGYFFRPHRDLELPACCDSSTQPHTKTQLRKAQISISVAALKENSDNFGFYVERFSQRKEAVKGIYILAVSPGFFCDRIAARLHALSRLPNKSCSFQARWSLTSPSVIANLKWVQSGSPSPSALLNGPSMRAISLPGHNQRR